MPDTKNDNRLNAQRRVNEPQKSPWTTDVTNFNEDRNAGNASATANSTAQSGNLDSTQGNNMDAHGSVSSNSSLVWDNNGDTVRLVAGSTNNFNDFAITASNELFGDAVESKRDATESIASRLGRSGLVTVRQSDNPGPTDADNADVNKKVDELNAALHNGGTARLEADDTASETASIASSDQDDWSREPARRNNGNAQEGSSPIWGDNNGTARLEDDDREHLNSTASETASIASSNSEADQDRLVQIRQKLAKLVGADPNKKFSEWSQKQQIHACGIVGGLLAIGAPIAVAGAVVVGIGAVVLGIIFGAGYLLGGGLATIKAAGIKTGQGFYWAAQKTNEGAQRVVEKTREAYAVADQRVRKSASDALRSVANRLEKMAGRTNHPEELSNIDATTRELYDEAVAVLNDEVLKNSDFSQEEKEAVVAAAMGKIAFKLGLKVKAQEDIIKSPNTMKEDREEAQEYHGLWTKQQSFIRDLNFKKLDHLLDVTDKSASRDLYLFKTALADHHEEVKSAVHEAVEKFLEYKQQERANNASNAAGKPKFFGWFSRKPQAVAKVKPLVEEKRGSTDTSTTTLASESSPMSGNDKGARVHFADVPGGTQRRHSHDGATLSSRILSDDNSSTLRRANSVNDLMQSNVNGDLSPLCGAHSVSDNLANGSSGAPSPVHGNNSLKPHLANGSVSDVGEHTGGRATPLVTAGRVTGYGTFSRGDEISQTRLKPTGFRDVLVHGDRRPGTDLVGTNNNVNQHFATVPARNWAIDV